MRSLVLAASAAVLLAWEGSAFLVGGPGLRLQSTATPVERTRGTVYCKKQEGGAKKAGGFGFALNKRKDNYK